MNCDVAKPQGKTNHFILKAKLNDRCFRYFTAAILMSRGTTTWRLHKKCAIILSNHLSYLIFLTSFTEWMPCLFFIWYDKGKHQLDVFKFTAPANLMALLIIIVHFIYGLYFSLQKVILILVPKTKFLKIPLSKLKAFERKW